MHPARTGRDEGVPINAPVPARASVDHSCQTLDDQSASRRGPEKNVLQVRDLRAFFEATQKDRERAGGGDLSLHNKTERA